MQAQLYEMQFSLLVLFFSLSLSYTTKASRQEDYFVFEGSVHNLPPDLMRTTTLPGPVSPILCGSECLLTPGCSRFFMEQSGDESFNCTLADKSVDWQPTKGSGGITVYSEMCNEIQQVSRPTDCQELREAGNDSSGYYTIYPDATTSINVYCDMQTDQGGWTVIQRRFNGDVDFYTTWTAYRDGFGTNADYWLGNHWIHQLTKAGNVELYIKLEDWSGERRFARYDNFSISSEADKYRLFVSGFSGDAGDSLLNNNGQQFSTKDEDNDSSPGHNCADVFSAGWWFNHFSLSNSNLNGLLLPMELEYKSMHWMTFRGHKSLKSSTMMIRRK